MYQSLNRIVGKNEYWISYLPIICSSIITILITIGQYNSIFTSNKFRIQKVDEYQVPIEISSSGYIFSVNDNNRSIAIYSYATKNVYFVHDNEDRVGNENIDVGEMVFGFSNPTDLKFDYQGNIWIADPVQKKVSIWTPKLKLKSIQDFNERSPSKIAPAEDFAAISFEQYEKNSGYIIISSSNTNKFTEVGRLPNDMKESSFYLDGTLITDGSFVFFGNINTGIISCYDLTGKLVYAIPTVQHVPLADINENNLELDFHSSLMVDIAIEKISSSSEHAIIDMDINSEYLIVLFAGNSNGVGEFLDIYSKSTGQYLGSIVISDFSEEFFTGLEVAENSLYLQTLSSQGRSMIQEFYLTAD